jgi:hypothetical protein
VLYAVLCCFDLSVDDVTYVLPLAYHIYIYIYTCIISLLVLLFLKSLLYIYVCMYVCICMYVCVCIYICYSISIAKLSRITEHISSNSVTGELYRTLLSNLVNLV